MIDLDNARAIVAKDSDGMLGHILGLPKQIEAAWSLTRSFDPPADYRATHWKPSAIVVLGMGGSAIGGDLVRTVVGSELKAPLLVVRDYDVPAYVGPTTLVIASSHSGQTEETLNAFKTALARGAKGLVISTGGTLLKRAEEAGLPAIQFAYPSQPRAAVGYSTTLLLGVLCRLGLVADKSADVAEAVALLTSMIDELKPEVPTERNLAKQLAQFFAGKTAVVYGGVLAEVARRWKGQFNENAKTWAFFEALPELDHNAVVGFQDPAKLRDHLAVVTLTSSFDSPRVTVREQVTDELMTHYGVPHRTVAARGKSLFAQVFSALYVADYLSYYVAALYEVDPTPIEAINHLKAELAKRG